jgi:hypothetical protein
MFQCSDFAVRVTKFKTMTGLQLRMHISFRARLGRTVSVEHISPVLLLTTPRHRREKSPVSIVLNSCLNANPSKRRLFRRRWEKSVKLYLSRDWS